jgi:hypothetical protein
MASENGEQDKELTHFLNRVKGGVSDTERELARGTH